MNELSTPAKCVLMASATLIIGFSTLASCRDRDANPARPVARGANTMAISALTFVTWPKESFPADDAPFIIGILGKPSAADEAMLVPYVEGKQKVQGRSVELRRYSTVRDIEKCHALMITKACEPELTRDALRVASGKSVLTMGESQGFTESGGVLSVVKNGEESVLQLNLRAADRQQLKIDVRLVNVSVLVKES